MVFEFRLVRLIGQYILRVLCFLSIVRQKLGEFGERLVLGNLG